MSGTKRLMGAATDGLSGADELTRGSTVLLLASCLEHQGQEACRDLLTVDTADRLNVIYLTFTRAGKSNLNWRETDSHSTPDQVVVIDATPGPKRTPAVSIDGVETERVGSPGNLTKIGVAVSKHCKEFEGDGTTVVCLRSLTALLQYVDFNTAYRFLNAVANQLASVGAIGHCHIDPDAHSTQELGGLRTLFDAVVAVDGGNEPILE